MNITKYCLLLLPLLWMLEGGSILIMSGTGIKCQTLKDTNICLSSSKNCHPNKIPETGNSYPCAESQPENCCGGPCLALCCQAATAIVPLFDFQVPEAGSESRLFGHPDPIFPKGFSGVDAPPPQAFCMPILDA